MKCKTFSAHARCIVKFALRTIREQQPRGPRRQPLVPDDSHASDVDLLRSTPRRRRIAIRPQHLADTALVAGGVVSEMM